MPLWASRRPTVNTASALRPSRGYRAASRFRRRSASVVLPDARALSALGGRGIFLGCSELTESILCAVSAGELALVDEQ